MLNRLSWSLISKFSNTQPIQNVLLCQILSYIFFKLLSLTFPEISEAILVLNPSSLPIALEGSKYNILI